MARHIEPLNGGLFTGPDPGLLQPGQLADMRNAVYRNGNQSLHRAKGRADFGAVTGDGSSVVGLRDIKFDNGEHYLLAAAGAAVYVTDVGDTGSFSQATTLAGTPTSISKAHYNNQFFIFNGVSVDTTATAANSNVIAYLSSTAASAAASLQFRVHGMLPVTSTPATADSGAAFSLTGENDDGFYEYWTTEVAKPTIDGVEHSIESTFSGTPVTVSVAATGDDAPVVRLPTIRNNSATHWRVYRSPKKSNARDVSFPIGYLINEMSTATAEFIDTSTTVSVSAAPASFNDSVFYSDFVSASSAHTDNGVYASATGASPTTPARQGYFNFNFGTVGGGVVGIEVDFQAYIAAGSGPVPLAVNIGTRDDGTYGRAGDWRRYGIRDPFTGQYVGLSKTAAKSVLVTATGEGAPQSFTVGSSTDPWLSGAPGDINKWVDSDFDDQFMAVFTTTTSGTTLGIEAIVLTVYYNGGSLGGVDPFGTVVYEFGGEAAQIGRDGPPPGSSTGDMYQGSLVVNDVDNPALIRYSYPLKPESFPGTYFIDIETEENDQVTFIKVVNDRLVIGTTTQLWRANYLPSERDASFDRGKAIQRISKDFGVYNEQCGAVFSPDGDTELLAFVSDKGIHTTNGFDIKTHTDGLSWRGVISTASTSNPIALINNPEERELIFFYRNDAIANDEHYLELHLNYSPEHMQNGMMKISGPVNARNYHVTASAEGTLESAWSVRRSNGDTSIYYGYGGSTAASAGHVMIASGESLPAQDPAWQYTTRDMYLAGFGEEFKVNQAHGYFSSGNGPAVVVTTKNLKTNATSRATLGDHGFTMADQRLQRIPMHEMCEGLSLSVSSTANHGDIAMDFITLDGDGFGPENSGL